MMTSSRAVFIFAPLLQNTHAVLDSRRIVRGETASLTRTGVSARDLKRSLLIRDPTTATRPPTTATRPPTLRGTCYVKKLQCEIHGIHNNPQEDLTPFPSASADECLDRAAEICKPLSGKPHYIAFWEGPRRQGATGCSIIKNQSECRNVSEALKAVHGDHSSIFKETPNTLAGCFIYPRSRSNPQFTMEFGHHRSKDVIPICKGNNKNADSFTTRWVDGYTKYVVTQVPAPPTCDQGFHVKDENTCKRAAQRLTPYKKMVKVNEQMVFGSGVQKGCYTDQNVVMYVSVFYGFTPGVKLICHVNGKFVF